MEQPFNLKYSQGLVKSTLSIANMYNEGKLRNENKAMLKVYQHEMQDSLKLHKYLYHCEACEASREGLRVVVKVLLRLSALIHEGRIETNEERYNSMKRFSNQFG